MNRVFALLLLVFVLLPSSVLAQSPKTEYFKARIISVSSKSITLEKLDSKNPEKISITRGDENKNFVVNDKVIVNKTTEKQKTAYFISDYVRSGSLQSLSLLFIISVVVIGRLKGILSLGGMIVSFFIIINMIVPQVLKGTNPVFITLLASIFIVPLTFYLAHGIRRETTVAVGATFISLFLTGILAYAFVDLARLTGFSSEEAAFVQTMTGGTVNIQNLLLAGIIIGALGVLDDITISQAAIVEKLAEANPKYTFRKLYQTAMSVGRDHIASLVNTLILVYAGASLPLFILFSNQKLPFFIVLNHEVIATEIVRTLVASIGIITAVPVATFLACAAIKKK